MVLHTYMFANTDSVGLTLSSYFTTEMVDCDNTFGPYRFEEVGSTSIGWILISQNSIFYE